MGRESSRPVPVDNQPVWLCCLPRVNGLDEQGVGWPPWVMDDSPQSASLVVSLLVPLPPPAVSRTSQFFLLQNPLVVHHVMKTLASCCCTRAGIRPSKHKRHLLPHPKNPASLFFRTLPGMQFSNFRKWSFLSFFEWDPFQNQSLKKNKWGWSNWCGLQNRKSPGCHNGPFETRNKYGYLL